MILAMRGITTATTAVIIMPTIQAATEILNHPPENKLAPSKHCLSFWIVLYF
jgi:hypothetical protein